MVPELSRKDTAPLISDDAVAVCVQKNVRYRKPEGANQIKWRTKYYWGIV